VKYHAKTTVFDLLPTPKRGTGETRQETTMLTEYNPKYYDIKRYTKTRRMLNPINPPISGNDCLR
jgi:hypothetical protein